ncbi:MAG TPA: hypothetical protein VJ302_25500 [Blastocatellia bacterium]|nr:hypothetical protein [Blastocatellia bacterium]
MSEELRSQSETTKTEAAAEPAIRGSHPYRTPTLNHFGTLVELVQQNPGPGLDGGADPASTAS